jgi:hypothetical protein
MESVTKKPKKKAKKAVAEEQPTAPATQIVPTGGYLWSRDEEELVDYEPEEPATFSPVEDDISVVGEDLSPPGDGQNNISSTTNDFSANLAEGGHMAGAKRSQIVLERESQAARPAGALASAAPCQKTIIPQLMRSRWIWRGQKHFRCPTNGGQQRLKKHSRCLTNGGGQRGKTHVRCPTNGGGGQQRS